MALQTIVEPHSEPVTVDEVKAYLAIGYTADDEMLAGLITAARRWCEVYTRRRFVRQTMRLLMDFFPGCVDPKVQAAQFSTVIANGASALTAGIRYAMQLPFPPVVGIVCFKYFNAAGVPTALVAGTDYVADLASEPARLTPPFAKFWPVAQITANAVQVDFVCGYGGTVPVTMDAAAVLITGSTFLAGDVGSAITIPGAGADGVALVTTIATVDPITGAATTTAAAVTAVTGAVAYIGKAQPEMLKLAIKMLVSKWYENRVPDETGVPMSVKSILSPYRDLRF